MANSSRRCAGRGQGRWSRRGVRGAILVLALLSLADAAWAGALDEVKGCRSPEEEGEFLQTCVRVAAGRRAGRVLGPGLVAPGGRLAAVLHHRRYGSPADRVTVRIYGTEGQLVCSFPMAGGGEEFSLTWASGGRYLAWVEVDGRGGLLRLADVRRQRIILTALSPLEEWPIFAPGGTLALIPRGRGGEDSMSARVQELELFDPTRRQRRVVLSAGPEEELVEVRWASASRVSATLRPTGGSKGKPVTAAVEGPVSESQRASGRSGP